MARKIGRLTDVAIRKAKKPGLMADGAGLYLRISPTGSKAWVFRYRRDGRLHDLGLGALHTFSLAEARVRAVECRKQRYDGLDPIETRRAKRIQDKLDAAKTMTFQECAGAYIDAKKREWSNPKHAAQWPSTLEAYVYPIFGDLPVQDIDTPLVMRALGPIWTEKPETASRVRGRIESVLDWATVSEFRQGENPARWKGHLEHKLAKVSKVKHVEHHAALPYTEIAAFVAELRQHEGIPARVLEFAILTAARSGEALGARWSEIDLEARLWTIPAERMKKADREHRVPLSDAALAIVEGLPRLGDFVFPGNRAGRPLSGRAMRMVLDRMGQDITIHGFRSTFSDWCAEQTTFPSEVREMALAHTVGNKVEAAYRRGDLFEKRRQLAEAWARYCATPSLDTNIVAFGYGT